MIMALMNSMTPREAFINDVLNDAFLKAVENGQYISISELDEIVFAHDFYEYADLDTIQEAVEQIEIILEENKRIVVSPIANGKVA